MTCPNCNLRPPVEGLPRCYRCGHYAGNFAAITSNTPPPVPVTLDSLREAIEKVRAIQNERETEGQAILRRFAALTPDQRRDIQDFYWANFRTTVPSEWTSYVMPAPEVPGVEAECPIYVAGRIPIRRRILENLAVEELAKVKPLTEEEILEAVAIAGLSALATKLVEWGIDELKKARERRIDAKDEPEAET